MLEKQKKHAFNKDIYLIGINKEGRKEWLEAASWDCNWYWGFGYIETYTNNNNPQMAKDIQSHMHFNGLFLNGPKMCYDMFKEHYQESVLSDKEIWMFLELMNTFYIAQKYSELMYNNGSHITESGLEHLKNMEEYDRINRIIIPEVTSKIYKLLTEEKKKEGGK